MSKYDDIIDMPAFEPKHHKRMERINRAAQFAPFDALTGLKDEISETEQTVTAIRSDPGFVDFQEN